MPFYSIFLGKDCPFISLPDAAFNFRNNLCIHSLLWVLNPIKLEEHTIAGYCAILDSILSANFPSEIYDPNLCNLVNPLSANFTKWSNTLEQFVSNLPTNCLSVFDYFVGLALKGLKHTKCRYFQEHAKNTKTNIAGFIIVVSLPIKPSKLSL